MKRLFLMLFAMVAVAITGCSQNKQNHKADASSAQNAKDSDKANAADGKNVSATKPGDGKV